MDMTFKDKVFLYRIKNSTDRDACAYIENKLPHFNCNSYFNTISVCGVCYSGGDWESYENIETILTEDEYNSLINFNSKVRELGWKIDENTDNYNKCLNLIESIKPIYEKLNSNENIVFYHNIVLDEMEYLKDMYGFSDDDIESIIDNYPMTYHDRAIVGCVYEDYEELGYNEGESLGYFESGTPIENFIDFEALGQAIADDDEYYLELDDGRIVYYCM